MRVINYFFLINIIVFQVIDKIINEYEIIHLYFKVIDPNPGSRNSTIGI